MRQSVNGFGLVGERDIGIAGLMTINSGRLLETCRIDTVCPPLLVTTTVAAGLVVFTVTDQYRKLAREDNGESLPFAGKTIEPGDSYAGIPQLFRLLRLLGDLAPGATAPSSSIYQGTLLEAVQHFQASHGIESTGRIDGETLNALNIPIAHRVAQLGLALERWRWVPHEFVRPGIVLNIPEFRLQSDDRALSMKVVVDKGYGHMTPVFAGEIQSVTFRPDWDVPLRIVREEFLPRIQENPAYLDENSYYVVDREGRVIEDEPGKEEVIERLRSGELGIRERPGGDNALGLVKFDFLNQSDMYMHGKPSTEQRDFNRGCIQVEDQFPWRNGCCETSRNGRRNILQTRCTGRRRFVCHS
jgi:murein L,D-transpeptidase YcbB/YkuD